MLSRSRLVVFGAIASLLLITGCPNGKVKNPTGTNAETELGGNGLKGDDSAGSGLKGKLTLPTAMLSADGAKLAYALQAITDVKPVVGATVSVTTATLKPSDQTGTSKTGADGSYAMRRVPANTIWFIKADFSNVTLYSMGVTIAKKNVEVNLSLGSTIATSGLWPLFSSTNNTKPYLLNDLDLTKFQALVKAIDSTLTNTTSIKPKKVLGDLTKDFATYMNATPSVKTAYDAVVADLSHKRELRALGRGNGIKRPDATVPADQVTDAGTTTSPTPTATPSTETATFDNVLVTQTAATVTGGLHSSEFSQVQVVSDPIKGPTLTIPDGDQFVTVSNTGTVSVKAASSFGNISFTGAQNFAVSGLNLYLVANFGGTPKLQSLDATALSGTAPAAKAIAVAGGGTVGAIASLIDADGGSNLFASDPTKGVIYSIKASDATATIIAGVAGQKGTGGATAKGAATSFKLNEPRGMVLVGTALYIADTKLNQILKYDTGAKTLEIIAGTGASLAPATAFTGGPLKTTPISGPTGIAAGSNETYYVSSMDRNTVMQLDLTNDAVVQLGTSATQPVSITAPQGLDVMGNDLWVVGQNQLVKLTLP